MNYSPYELLCLFLIYSFLGWCCEVAYAAIVHGEFVNRGFDIGPVCPIYGFGALSVILFLEPLKAHWAAFFLASVLFTTFIEFMAGFLLERFFHEKWWDYTNEPYNIKGYICPRFSLMWGFACVIVVYVVHPTIVGLVGVIPEKYGYILLGVLYGIFLTDLTLTIVNVMHIRSSLRAVAEIEASLEKLSVSIGTNISSKTIELVGKTKQIKDTLDEKQENVKEAIEAAQLEFEEDLGDAREKHLTKKKAIDERRRAQYEDLMDRLQRSKDNIARRSARISRAFPHIKNGRYKHIFAVTLTKDAKRKAGK